MKIKIPEGYRKTNGKAQNLDRYLKVKMLREDLSFLQENLLLDHAETFIRKDGEWFVVSHPYPSMLNEVTLVRLRAVCERSGITYQIFDDSWYGEQTKRIEFYNARVHN